MFLVLSSAVGPHPLRPWPADVATIVELAEHRVKYTERARKLLSASFMLWSVPPQFKQRPTWALNACDLAELVSSGEKSVGSDVENFWVTAYTSGKHCTGQSAASLQKESGSLGVMCMTRGLKADPSAWLCEPRERCCWAGGGIEEYEVVPPSE